MVLGAIAALYAVILFAPPLISTDIFSYQAYSRMGAVHGVSPYLNGPHAIAGDALFPYIGAKWSYIPSVYGPVFTALSYVLAPLSIVASVVAYKFVAALSALAIVAMVWNLAQRRGVDPVRAAALVGLNPLLALYGPSLKEEMLAEARDHALTLAGERKGSSRPVEVRASARGPS